MSASLANLLCVPIWTELLALQGRNEYFLAVPLRPGRVVATIGLVLAFAAAFLAGARLRDRLGWTWLPTASFLGLCAVAYCFVRLHFPWLSGGSPEAASRALALTSLAVGLFAWASRRWGGPCRLAYLGLLALSPFAAVTLGHAVILVARHDPARFSPPVANRQADPSWAPAPRRLALVVFDEFDETAAFEGRPRALRLPAFDRLRSEAWVARNAFPANNTTLGSVPAILSGEAVERAVARGPSSLDVEIGGRRRPWSSLPSLFASARQEGVSVAIAGWYHPYCRLFAEHASSCRDFSLYPEPAPDRYPRLFLARTAARLPGMGLLGARGGPIDTDPFAFEDQLRRHEGIHAAALAAARDPRYGLVYVHYSIPHGPLIHDRARGAHSPNGTYGDNLALADRALDELRRALEQAGASASALLVTSDHSRRKGAHPSEVTDLDDPTERVPLLFHVAGMGPGPSHDPIVRGSFVHDLALAYLRGEVSDHADVSALALRHARGGLVAGPHGGYP